ncbi:MAG TPA: hypothetical protein VFI49_08115 [Rudaea sp.]|nr:hypothetical protein [Rudaea sp.]
MFDQVCRICGRPVGESDVVGRAEADDFQFSATPSPAHIPADFNPWASGQFANQPEWLLRKRDECLRDIRALKVLLDKVRSAFEHETKHRLDSVLRQASGAYRDLERIDRMLCMIDPTFDRATLPKLELPRSAPIPDATDVASYYQETKNAA